MNSFNHEVNKCKNEQNNKYNRNAKRNTDMLSTIERKGNNLNK